MVAQDDEKLQNYAIEWVVRLQKEGGARTCVDENDDYRDVLPSYFDYAKFCKGQQFFKDNIFAMFYGKMHGLMTILTIPTILKLLIFTRMSTDAFSSYRRYLSTLFHMYHWYTSDFSVGSKLWQSIRVVRNKHNSASRRSLKAGFHQISQKDMALTQFGFMGYAIVRSKEIGIHECSDEELECFIHVWRVIGYIMGIEDRFNLCHGTLEQTRAICEELISREFAPAYRRRDKEFARMSSALCDGLWCINPFIKTKIFSATIAKLLHVYGIDNNNADHVKDNLSFWEKVHIAFIKYTILLMQFKIFKLMRNSQMRVDFWLMNNFPFLAYYKFGYANSHVKVLHENSL